MSRRAIVVSAAAAALGVARLRPLGRVVAQEGEAATPAVIGTPPAGIGAIRSTREGPVPSTGGSRPGPAGRVQELPSAPVVAPVGLTIPSAGVDAGIERLRVVDGDMPDPTGPWVVAWYENLGSLGQAGNVVMAGHIDFWNVGPSVFYNVANVQPGDPIVVSGDDGKRYPFTVEWVRQYDSTAMPLDEVAGPTPDQCLTLITCGGAFDYVNGHYLQRTVVRATRSGPGQSMAT
ncbi:MAG: class F sortase [Thermomicrobiales bacterium]|nr:class F sortase [Thermomicrobiales bacterium]